MKIFKLLLFLCSMVFVNHGWAQNTSVNSKVKEGKQDKTPAINIVGQPDMVNGKPGILVKGTTIGLEVGTTLVPYFRFPGQTQYSRGKAKIQVDKKGEFSWKRKTSKKIYIYFATEDRTTTSNRIIIQAK